MSKVPMMSVNPSAKKTVAPVKKAYNTVAEQVGIPATTTTTGPVEVAPVTNTIPRQPMMSYNIEGTIMPGVTDITAKNLQKYAKENSKTPEEEKLLLTDMYQAAVKEQQRKAYLKDREEMKGQMIQKSLSATDPEEKKSIDTAVKLANLSDVIRQGAKKEGIDIFDMNDKDVVAGFGESNPEKQEMILNYLNGKIDSVEVGKQIGLIPAEESAVGEQDEGNVIKDIGEGMTSYAGGIPKAIAETGLLDKPLMAIANKIRSAMGKRELTPEEQELLAYSKEAAGSQVGGNTESKVAKGVEGTMNTLEIMAGLPMVAKGIVKLGDKYIAKQATKNISKNKGIIADIISEPETTKAVQKALQEKRLVEGSSGKIKRIIFGEKGAKIVPTKQIDEAVDIIQKNIPNPDKTPTGLFNQLSNFVENKSKSLSEKLKGIKIGTMTKAKAEVKKSINELTKLSDEFTTSEIKKISGIKTKIDKIKNLDELRSLRKQFDDMFSDSIKQATKSSAPTTRKANRIWKSVRSVLNDKLDEIAENIGDVSTKKEFKDMSAIFKAKDNIIGKAGIKMLKPTKGIITKKNVIGAGATAVGLKVLGNKIGE